MHTPCSKLFLACLLVSVLIASVAVGRKAHKRIVGGALTTIDEVPYLVQLRDITGRFFCGGSLVAPNYVVTAAHCLDTTEQRHIVVVGGATTSVDDGVESKIAEKFVHPLYERSIFTYDIAVLKLASPISGKNIKPIPLCSLTVGPRQLLQVSGWGYTSESKPGVSHQMRTVRVPTYSFDDCKRMYGTTAKITETMMCASVPGEKDACTTDSGGPAVVNGQLCGVVSWGTGCGRVEYPGVYTNIPKVISFIKESMKK